MIPQGFVSQPAVQLLMEYLDHEIRTSLSQRRSLEEKWVKWQRMYRCIPEQEVKDFPFVGAANLVAPLIATDVDVMAARFMGMLFAPENLWTVKASRPDMMEFAARAQEFLTTMQQTEIRPYRAVFEWILEVCKLGTGILKQRYRREQKQVYEFRERPFGPPEESIRRVLLKDGPELRHVSLWDFLQPPMAYDIQNSAWTAERVMLDWQQYVNRVRSGLYVGQDRISASMANQKGSWVFEQLMKLDKYEPGLGTKLELWEVWLDFDIANSGEPMSLVCTIHLPSMTYVRLDFNPWFNQERPYSYARYMAQEGRFYGIGLAEMDEMPQDEITAIHNQRIDSGTIANSAMFKARRGAGIKEDEPIYPGRWFILDDPNDIQTMPMGDLKYDSSPALEQSVLQYAIRRTGVNDYVMGASAPNIGYSTAYTTMAQQEQATKRFDQTLREIREALGESGVRILEMYQQFNQAGKVFQVMGPDDAAVVMQFLQFPLELVRNGVVVSVTATSAANNKEVEIRTNVTLMQMLSQFYAQNLQAMMYAVNPQVPPPIRELAMLQVRGSTQLMRRILDSYGIQDVDDFLPRQGGQNGFAGGAVPGMAGAGLGAAGQPGMAGIGGFLPPGFEAAGLLGPGNGGLG